MFSTQDVRDLLQAFPPPKSEFGSLPSFVESTSGQDLVSLRHIQSEFAYRAECCGPARIDVSELASVLNVDPEIIIQLAQDQFCIALLSRDNSQIIPKAELTAIAARLREGVSGGLVLTTRFAVDNDVSLSSLDTLLKYQEDWIVHYDDHVCSQEYDDKIAEYAAREIIDRKTSSNNYGFFTLKDCAALPGLPPKWFILQHLQRLAESANYRDKVFIQDESVDTIRIQSTQARAQNVLTMSQLTQANNFEYIDLQSFMHKGGLYDSLDDVLSDFAASPDFVVIDAFALSAKWFHGFLDARLDALGHADEGMIDMFEGFGEKVQKTWDGEGHRKFPESLYGEVQRKAEAYVDDAIASKPELKYRRFGTVMVTEAQYDKEREALIDGAADIATSQWQQLNDGAEVELKFIFTDPTDSSTPRNAIHASLTKDKPLQKATEERFWTTISTHETQNESSFATFWTERVASRIAIYTEGLSSIQDPKLGDQLSELLATYIQKDLVPDALAKARAQNLLLSRKSKKNVSKLESALQTATDLPSIHSTLSKFLSKQSTPPPSTSSLDTTKTTMIQDMQRRMTKLQKSSDGPVLFLTLVVILHAKHFPGIVYATGKYAPKLLKMLKGKVSQEEYEVLEGWKEGAKRGVLGEGERLEMRGMAGA